MADDARIILNADGTIAAANDAALALFGASLSELVSAPRGAFTAHPQSPEARAALREAWEAQGNPDIVGEGTIGKPRGGEVRVRFGITREDDGRFLAVLRPIRERTSQPPKVFTAGEVLAEWREAERELQAVTPDSPEATAIQREIERFRKAYQQLFASRGDGSPA